MDGGVYELQPLGWRCGHAGLSLRGYGGSCPMMGLCDLLAGTTVPAAGSVTIASGTATGDIKWKSDNVWNNDGDTAYLYDGSGRLVSQKRG